MQEALQQTNCAIRFRYWARLDLSNLSKSLRYSWATERANSSKLYGGDLYNMLGQANTRTPMGSVDFFHQDIWPGLERRGCYILPTTRHQ